MNSRPLLKIYELLICEEQKWQSLLQLIFSTEINTVSKKQHYDRIFNRLLRTQQAICRFHNQQFGWCQDCGQEINPKRLEMLLCTTRCLACQRGKEKNGSDS